MVDYSNYLKTHAILFLLQNIKCSYLNKSLGLEILTIVTILTLYFRKRKAATSRAPNLEAAREALSVKQQKSSARLPEAHVGEL